MSLTCPPLMRFALHLLLALAVVLQAGASLAMGPAAALSAPAQQDPTAATAATPPPCHALANRAADAIAATPHDGCDGSALGETCRWACAQAISVPASITVATSRPAAIAESAAPAAPALRWAMQSPLRPPIG